MTSDKSNLFSGDEKEILQEIMNIAFGNATADLAEVVDIYVQLSVPEIDIISIGKLPDYLQNTIETGSKVSVVDQKFWGDFNGSGLLVFPSETGTDLLTLFKNHKPSKSEPSSTESLNKGVLLEIGNLLIGACVGKISELLDTFVTYSPPQVLSGSEEGYTFLKDYFNSDQAAIIMKTIFKFKKEDLNGLLLILTNQESIGWLRKSLADFMQSYE